MMEAAPLRIWRPMDLISPQASPSEFLQCACSLTRRENMP